MDYLFGTTTNECRGIGISRFNDTIKMLRMALEVTSSAKGLWAQLQLNWPGSTIGKLNSRLNRRPVWVHLFAKLKCRQHCRYHDPDAIVSQKPTDANPACPWLNQVSKCQKPGLCGYVPTSKSKITHWERLPSFISVWIKLMGVAVDPLVMRYGMGVGVDHSPGSYQPISTPFYHDDGPHPANH